jgi:hypothetical protein
MFEVDGNSGRKEGWCIPGGTWGHPSEYGGGGKTPAVASIAFELEEYVRFVY